MSFTKYSKFLITALLIFSVVGLYALAPNCAGPTGDKIPPHVYLSWANPDTSRTMTVTFHSNVDLEKAYIHYDVASQNAKPKKYNYKSSSEVIVFDGKEEAPPRHIHNFDLQDLAPYTLYHFTISDGKKALTPEYKFRTLPADDTPIRFVNGGDMGMTNEVAKLHKVATSKQPMLAVLGGDYTYENGRLHQYYKWDEWLSMWQKHLRGADGELLPFIFSIGNHETTKGYIDPGQEAPFFQTYMNRNRPETYFHHMAGPNAAFIALDTGHMHHIGGEQTAWLKQTLETLPSHIFKIPYYHVPMYPSHRAFNEQKEMRQARANWLPLFDLHDVRLALEHHDHSLKRTKPLRANQVHAGGTIYLGDGCWGRSPRSVSADRWYLAKAENIRHVWSGEIHKDKVIMQAFDMDGALLDEVTIYRDSKRRKKN